MIEYRRAAPSELPECIEFINLVFSMAHEPHDFKALLPKAYAEDACFRPEHYIALENGKIVGLVGLLPGEMTILGKTLSYGIVGSVSAHPYHRGAGHMKGCMALMQADAERMGLQLLYLGGMRQRYEYFGFVPGGHGMFYSIGEENVRHGLREEDDAPFSFEPIQPYVDEAASLYACQPVHALRPAKDFAMICRSDGNHAQAILKNNAFAGYLVRGDQAPGEVSELLLRDHSDLRAVVKALYRDTQSRLHIIEPVWQQSHVRVLNRFASHCEAGTLDLFRIEDWKANLRLWLPLKAEYTRLREGTFVLQVEKGVPMEIHVEGNQISVTETEKAPDASLSRIEAEDLLLGLHRWVDTSAMPPCVENWFPLPITTWSPDTF